MLRKPFRLFTLLRFFKFNCFRFFLLRSSYEHNFVFVEVFIAVTKFSFFLLPFKLFQIVCTCFVFFRMFYVVLGSLICCSFLLCSRFCLVVFGRLSSVSCLRLFMFVLLFSFFILHIVLGCCRKSTLFYVVWVVLHIFC